MQKYKKLVFIAFCFLLVLLGGAAVYFYLQFSGLKSHPQEIAEEETKKILEKVRMLIVLPEGEQPTVATITDPEKLKDQTFFANAKAGDKVLIYTKAKKAILYDPLQHKIIEVAPLNIGN